VNSTLGGSHGVPRVHFKGRQGDYYVMVLDSPFLLFLFFSPVCIIEVRSSLLCFGLRLWTCLGLAYGIYGILQGKRESPLHILGELLSLFQLALFPYMSILS